MTRQDGHEELDETFAEHQVVEVDARHAVRVPLALARLERIVERVLGGDRVDVADVRVVGAVAEQARLGCRLVARASIAIVHAYLEQTRLQVLVELLFVEQAGQVHVRVVHVDVLFLRRRLALVVRLLEEVVAAVGALALVAQLRVRVRMVGHVGELLELDGERIELVELAFAHQRRHERHRVQAVVYVVERLVDAAEERRLRVREQLLHLEADLHDAVLFQILLLRYGLLLRLAGHRAASSASSGPSTTS